MALNQVGLERLNTATTDKIGIDKNLIINGEFIVDQRMGGSATAITPSGGVDYTDDRWHESNNGGEAARITYQTVSGDTPNANYRQSIKLDCTTQMGTPSGDNWMGFCQFIESQNISFLGHGTSTAKPITLQFWIKSTKTGTATVQLLRHDASREYLAEYTINQSNTWEKKTITIPGDTSGTEAAFDNGRGFKLCFVLFAGSSRHGTVGTWRALNGGYFGASANQVNLLDSTSNNIFFTGIQLEQGTEDTGFQHRSINSELTLCQRYFQTISRSSNANTVNGTFAAGTCNDNGSSGGILQVMVRFQTTMRAVPTMTQSGTFSHHVSGVNVADTTVAFNQAYIDGVKCTGTQTAFVSADGSCGELISKYSDTSTAIINASAEL